MCSTVVGGLVRIVTSTHFDLASDKHSQEANSHYLVSLNKCEFVSNSHPVGSAHGCSGAFRGSFSVRACIFFTRLNEVFDCFNDFLLVHIGLSYWKVLHFGIL